MKANADSPIINETLPEIKEEAPMTDAPKKRGPKKAAAQNEEVQDAAEEAPAPKKRGRKPGVKNGTAKKETAKKAPAKRTAKTAAAEKTSESKSTSKKMEEQITIQYAGRECTKDSLTERVSEIWTNDYGRKVSEIKKVAFYVKPEEFTVYYVINDDITGKFDI